ncbi:hypothetical protein LTR28_006616, partial [Elasticomyces elasticus]
LGEAWGKTFRIWSQSKDILEGLGFVDVVEKRYRWPLNPWSKDKRMKEIGFWNRQRTLEGMEGFMLRLLTNTGNASTSKPFFAQERTSYLRHVLWLTSSSGQLRKPKSSSQRCGWR